MTFRCIFKLFVYFFLISTSGLCSLDTTCSQISVVIFFADSGKIPTSAAGIKFLEMQEMARVKHSFPTSRDTHPYLYISQRNAQNCEELLHDGLESLTHFCQNALGMKTATVSISSKSISNDVYNAEPENPQIRNSLAQRGPHKSRRRKDTDDDTAPNKLKKTALKDVITSPEHTEVFNIRVKRDGVEDVAETKTGEIVDVALGREKTKPQWDVLDVMSHVRFSFFGNLFEDEKKKKLSKEENEMLSNMIGQKKLDPGLFESVTSTLSTLQEIPGEPFLMIVFGGQFSEICDKHSPLLQSVKHVVESTDPKKTLIILTGACPEGKWDTQKEHDNTVVIKESFNPEQAKEEKNSILPVYARGPKSEQLTRCSVLYDIPLTLKDILEEMSPTFGGRS